MENLEMRDENLTDDEIIRLRVKGAMESLKNKVISDQGKELQEKNEMTKEVEG